MTEGDRSQADPGRTELPALTSLRGLAALTVVFYHASFLALNYADGGPPMLWRRGYLAVDLFFLLSGFVLTRIPQMDWAGRTEGRGNAGETAGSFFHPSGPSEFGYLIQRKSLI